jgi:hypothetical protein
LQAWTAFAPVLGSPRLTGFLFHNFYQHAPERYYAENLKRYGARPVGFCASPPDAQR